MICWISYSYLQCNDLIEGTIWNGVEANSMASKRYMIMLITIMVLVSINIEALLEVVAPNQVCGVEFLLVFLLTLICPLNSLWLGHCG